jgi:hypothetical protein
LKIDNATVSIYAPFLTINSMGPIFYVMKTEQKYLPQEPTNKRFAATPHAKKISPSLKII